MSKQPLVSVIINCFNGEKYLREALNSVIAQTYKNWEIIFWDNQSTDQSAGIFKSYNDKRLKYYYASSYTSLYQARNYAIKKCNGEFIAFLDSDDWWTSEKLETQMNLFEDKEVGLVYSNYYIYNEETQRKKLVSKKKLPSGTVTNSLLTNYNVGIITVIIRKVLFDRFKDGFDGKYNIIGDFDFIIKLSKFSKFACIQTGLSYWRSHKNNSSYINYELEIKELEDWLTNQKVFDKSKFYNLLKNIKLKITYMIIINNILNGNLKKAVKDIISFPLSLKKIRLIMALLITKKFLKKIKNIN